MYVHFHQIFLILRVQSFWYWWVNCFLSCLFDRKSWEAESALNHDLLLPIVWLNCCIMSYLIWLREILCISSPVTLAGFGSPYADGCCSSSAVAPFSHPCSFLFAYYLRTRRRSARGIYQPRLVRIRRHAKAFYLLLEKYREEHSRNRTNDEPESRRL